MPRPKAQPHQAAFMGLFQGASVFHPPCEALSGIPFRVIHEGPMQGVYAMTGPQGRTGWQVSAGDIFTVHPQHSDQHPHGGLSIEAPENKPEAWAYEPEWPYV